MKTNPFDLDGKNIVITGASSGIGRECAINCSMSGANVLIIGRNQEKLQETETKLRSDRNNIHLYLDITDFSKVQQSIKDISGNFGKIHGLINAAGISPTIPFRMLSVDKMEETFKVNVIASMQIAKEICKPIYANETGMSIIFISSVMSEAGEAGKSLYGMSKAALIAGAKSLSVEYAAKKIRFNCISPGVVLTPMSEKSVYSKDKIALEKVVSQHPLGLGKPEDVANAAVFLLSDASRWITGTNMIVDGGYLAR